MAVRGEVVSISYFNYAVLLSAMDFAHQRTSSSGVAKRACDECRARKTRCDRGSPCSHCRAATLVCRTTAQRSKEHIDRVQVTKQYEKKIDRIESRLANIEQLLRQSTRTSLAISTQETPSSSDTESAHINHGSTDPHVRINLDTHMPGTGDMGLQAESMIAKDMLEQTIEQDSAIRQDSQLLSALQSLRGIVNRSLDDSADRPTGQRTKTSDGSSAWETLNPSWEQVETVLERAKKICPVMFNLLSPALFENFDRKCRAMYKEGREGSPVDKLLVYAAMTNICSQFSGTDDGDSATHNYNLARAFSNLLLQALTTFPMLTPGTVETVECLMVASLTTTGLGKPSLSWSLSCTAARMCQALGYNRLSRVDPNGDSTFSRKVMLFWTIYIMDRNNSLRLGHAPAIQDYDIDTPRMTASDDYPPAMIALLQFWVESGKVQGKIRTQLFGPAALSLDIDKRTRIAEDLADQLTQIHQRKTTANPSILPLTSRGQQGNSAEIWLYGDDIMHFSNLTTALSAIPPSHPHRSHAVEAARQCLRICQNVSKKYRDNLYNWTCFCHWVLLRVPLTFFTGIFYNIIANPHSSRNDLELLEDFVASFQPARRLSEGIDRFYQLCIVFVTVAQEYVRAKSQEQPTHDKAPLQKALQALQPVMGDFFMHSFDPEFFDKSTTIGNTTSRTDGSIPNGRTDNSPAQQEQFLDLASLPDWYSGNVSLYGLLEQDFNDMDKMDFGDFGESTSSM